MIVRVAGWPLNHDPHPGNGLRWRMLRSRRDEPGRIELTAAESERIDAELGAQWELVRREVATW